MLNVHVRNYGKVWGQSTYENKMSAAGRLILMNRQNIRRGPGPKASVELGRGEQGSW